jgi:hypothetical protein
MRFVPLITTLILVAVTAPRSAAAQDRGGKQDTSLVFVQPDSMATAMGQVEMFMGPMMGRMMENMVEGLLTALAKPDNAERLATFAKNYFDALKRKGFTDEQALRLVAAVGFPSIGGGGN